MPKRPTHQQRKLTSPRTRQSQRRSGKPLVIFGGCLLVLLALYANLVVKTTNSHASVVQRDNSRIAATTPQQRRRENANPENALTYFRQQDRQSQNSADSDPTTLLVFTSPHCKGEPADQATARTKEPIWLTPSVFPKSVLLRGKALAEVFVGGDAYKGTVMEVEGCVDFYHLFENDKQQAKFGLYAAANTEKVLTAERQIKPELQKKFATTDDLTKPHTRFVFSCTSSQYFGYQLYANALAFLDSKQTSASWTRLMSAGQFDDLKESFPTFTAPKSLYNNFYQPINKPDVIDKWFHSPDAPHPDDTIVVIDPDNWLINDLHKWTSRVTAKHASAQAAYYSGNPMLQDLWKDICRRNCDVMTDPGAVPYLMKASDLKEVAPLWRSYSMEIKQRFLDNSTFKEKYGPGLGVRWAAEMFAFNGACTHLDIKTTIVSDMQLRDVDGGKRNWNILRNTMPMIHMGRAWFPKDKPEVAAPWRHSSSNEPSSVAASGIQVWCKCNGTAPFIQPWPLPENMDFVSYHTLRLLHDSVEKFGPVPVNENFRKQKLNFYQWSVP